MRGMQNRRFWNSDGLEGCDWADGTEVAGFLSRLARRLRNSRGSRLMSHGWSDFPRSVPSRMVTACQRESSRLRTQDLETEDANLVSLGEAAHGASAGTCVALGPGALPRAAGFHPVGVEKILRREK